MHHTFNGCYHSPIKVTPSNWYTTRAKTSTDWRIYYRFYDPVFKENKNLWGKLVQHKGMNDEKVLKDRQDITSGLIAEITRDLQILGLNPVTKKFMAPVISLENNILTSSSSSGIQWYHNDIPIPGATAQVHIAKSSGNFKVIVTDSGGCTLASNSITFSFDPTIEIKDINEATSCIQALEYALKNVNVEHDTRIDIRSTLKYFELSAVSLGRQCIPIGLLRAKAIESILDNCANLEVNIPGQKIRKKVWNDNQFNHYRKNLRTLFTYLELKLEILEYNPIDKIDLRVAEEEEIEIVRDVLTNEQRNLIDDSLAEDQPNFHRFINIFFPSGSRIKEIHKVQGRHVDLVNQKFKVRIRKGKKKPGVRRARWVWKTITDEALPYWRALMTDCLDENGNKRECHPDEYVFSEGLKPGTNIIRPEQFTRRWLWHVKSKLGVTADLYSLKHLFTTELKNYINHLQDKSLGSKIAAEHNSHTTERMVNKIYDTDRLIRRHNLIRVLPITFRKVTESGLAATG